MEIYNDKPGTGKLIPPRKTGTIDLLLKANNVDHPLAKKYLEEYAEYQKNFESYLQAIPKKPEVELPELKPIEFESFYQMFLEAFRFFNGKDFDENANDGESRLIAKTIAAYILKRKKFSQSPLLNYASEPNINKGLMVIGGYGTGKTSIIQTFHKMIQYSFSNPIGVKDIDGTMQFLGRYRLGFGFFTANQVVKDFEAISSPEDKELFWKRMSTGMKYFDDVMTEQTASNYGKIEVFKDILEMRYVTGAKTIISLNYSGSTVEETLDAIASKYGERVYDRVFEMFNIVELKGKSLRK